MFIKYKDFTVAQKQCQVPQPTDITDEEAEPEDVGVLARIWTVFKKIFDAIASLFNR